MTATKNDGQWAEENDSHKHSISYCAMMNLAELQLLSILWPSLPYGHYCHGSWPSFFVAIIVYPHGPV